MGELLFKNESFRIRGAIFNVYNTIGCGFLEAVYQECLRQEFDLLNIPYQSEVDINIEYKGFRLEKTYRADFVCYDKVILEIKAVQELEEIHTAQVINYLKATGLKLGLLVNFGSSPKVDIKRIVLERN